MTKAALRKIYKEKRKSISAAEKSKLEDLLLIQFQTLPIEIPNVVMSYAPMEKFNEYDPYLVEQYCAFKAYGQQLALPVITGDDLKAVLINDETIFSTNSFGVQEPENGEELNPGEIEIVFVPLLIFDKEGYRVGYGKGFYDRFLVQCRADVIKVGFCFFDAIEKIEDRGEHDIQLDYCITPHLVYSF